MTVAWADLGELACRLTRIDPTSGIVDGDRYHGRDWPDDAETMIGVPRLRNIIEAVGIAIAEDIPGDLAECGVWRGGACIMMRACLDAFSDRDRQVWVCDSFAGLPKPDDRYPGDRGDRHWTHNDYLAVPRPEVEENFARYGLLDNRVRFVEGFFEDSLPGPIERLAVLRLDGDMYSSTIHTLDALHPLVSPGGFVIVDDYGGGGNGCQQAVDRYRQEHEIPGGLAWIEDSGAVQWRK